MDALSGDAGARAVLLLQPLVDGVWPPATAVVVVDGSQASGAQGRSVRAAGWGPGREERPPACAWSPPSWRQAALQPLPLDAPKMHRPAAALCAEVVPVTLRLQRGAGGGMWRRRCHYGAAPLGSGGGHPRRCPAHASLTCGRVGSASTQGWVWLPWRPPPPPRSSAPTGSACGGRRACASGELVTFVPIPPSRPRGREGLRYRSGGRRAAVSRRRRRAAVARPTADKERTPRLASVNLSLPLHHRSTLPPRRCPLPPPPLSSPCPSLSSPFPDLFFW